MRIVILGSGPSGIAAGYGFKRKGLSPVLYEKDSDWGGLCNSFTLEGFRFDRFVHFAHSLSPELWTLFNDSSPLFPHIPVARNYYKGTWLKNPAQHNLFPLSCEEKVRILTDFVQRPCKGSPKNYAEWLVGAYGETFARHFAFAYTRKYWRKEPHELGIQWIGERMVTLSLEEMLRGAFEEQKQNFYYTTHMNYPLKGGFRSIFDVPRRDLDIQFNKKVVRIAPCEKRLFFEDATQTEYDLLLSSLPLPEMGRLIEGAPHEVCLAAETLQYTSGFQVSLGFNRPDVAQDLWFYIYDEEILAARVYSPNLKAQDNVPKGCSALQAEVFFSNREKTPDPNMIFDRTVAQLVQIGLFSKKDLHVTNIRYEKYANVIFDHAIDKNRLIILNYFSTVGIFPIGRFGKWDYLWTHQSFQDGLCMAEALCQK
ncbi:MAG: FAD-dependent oxidoreductase, partial [Holosporales bacterium]|nr:FAD-dependent oxidoreductase [Holosporales bacterium]